MAMYSSEQTVQPQATPRRPGDGPAHRTRTRALVFMALALVAGVSAALLITRWVSHRPERLAAVPMLKVVVAAQNLPTAAALTKESLQLVDWPKAVLPEGTFTDGAQLEGRITNGPLVKGEPILAAHLAPPGARQGMAAVIPENMRAMTVPVNEVVGVGGFIHPGDYVDVVATMQTPVGNKTAEQEFRSKIVLQNIRVLAVGEDLMADSSKPLKVPIVTLLVTPEESERLALASTQGKVQLTMRANRDQTAVATAGVSPAELLNPRALAVSAPAEPIAQPTAAAVASRHRSRRVAAAPTSSNVSVVAPAPKKESEVVEILRGDRLEERKLRPKEVP